MESVNCDDAFARRFAGQVARVDGDEKLEALRRPLADYCVEHTAELTTQPFLGWYTSTTKLGRLRWALERFASLSHAHKVAIEFVFLPYLKSDEHPTAYASVRAIVAHECERAGVAYHDAQPALDGVALRTFRQTLDDGLHLNAAAHERVANLLAPLMVK